MGIAILPIVLAIAGYMIAARRPGHTRAHLVIGATIGGGVGGALFACAGAIAGQSFPDLLPFALLGLWYGVLVGFAGLVAFAVGKWLGREP